MQGACHPHTGGDGSVPVRGCGTRRRRGTVCATSMSCGDGRMPGPVFSWSSSRAVVTVGTTSRAPATSRPSRTVCRATKSRPPAVSTTFFVLPVRRPSLQGQVPSHDLFTPGGEGGKGVGQDGFTFVLRSPGPLFPSIPWETQPPGHSFSLSQPKFSFIPVDSFLQRGVIGTFLPLFRRYSHPP